MRNIAPAARASVPRSAEFTRLTGETLELIAAGAKAAAERVVAQLGAPADPRPLETVQQEYRVVLAAMTGTRRATRDTQRRLCETLMLYRICPRAGCRKAYACRGNPDTCYRRAGAPAAVQGFAVRLMLEEHLPLLPMLAETAAQERLAYEGWIAAIDARSGA